MEVKICEKVREPDAFPFRLRRIKFQNSLKGNHFTHTFDFVSFGLAML